MSSSLSTEAPTTADFACACEKEWMRSACVEFEEYEGTGYCVLHYPSKDKTAAFNEVLKKKLDAGDFDFQGVWFPDVVDFNDRTFAKPVSFAYATFSADAYFRSVTFSAGAYFSSATFNATVDFTSANFGAEANFVFATFGEAAFFGEAKFGAEADFGCARFDAKAYFDSATFNAGAYFRSAWFNAETYFASTTFDADAYFLDAMFIAEANFNYTTFKGYTTFAGDGKHQVFNDAILVNLQFVRIETPNRLSFHTLTLRPLWFVNVDAREFELVNVTWRWRSAQEEIKSLEESGFTSPHSLLAIACRNLAVNAEENHRYEEASRFRYMAMEARRLESWQSWRGFISWILGWLYWAVSGYGERMGRAFLVLLGILVLFAALYLGLGFPNWETKAATERAAVEVQHQETGVWPRLLGALTYSLGVMTLQKPEPRPATNAAQSLVMLETILGPVQAALLALAIRRKFMR